MWGVKVIAPCLRLLSLRSLCACRCSHGSSVSPWFSERVLCALCVSSVARAWTFPFYCRVGFQLIEHWSLATTNQQSKEQCSRDAFQRECDIPVFLHQEQAHFISSVTKPVQGTPKPWFFAWCVQLAKPGGAKTHALWPSEQVRALCSEIWLTEWSFSLSLPSGWERNLEDTVLCEKLDQTVCNCCVFFNIWAHLCWFSWTIPTLSEVVFWTCGSLLRIVVACRDRPQSWCPCCLSFLGQMFSLLTVSIWPYPCDASRPVTGNHGWPNLLAWLPSGPMDCCASVPMCNLCAMRRVPHVV